ncbi:MAG: Nif3-like dinuclear metal center hexameric protein [Bacteroidota bacterium]
MTQLRSLIRHLESFAPPVLQETYDNSGLLVGHPDMEVAGVTVSLDCTEEVIREAVANGSNVVVAHHPIVFGGLKRLTGRNYIERTVLEAIRNGVAIYAIHTNLDNVRQGVNLKISERLGLINARILSPKKGLLRKLITFCPLAHTENVLNALFSAGAGSIGDYDECSFTSKGIGSYRPLKGSAPFIGQHGVRQNEQEERLEVIFEFWKEQDILSALRSAHPYEEVAYDLYALENEHHLVGSGMIGELTEAMDEPTFMHFLKDVMKTACIRHSRLLGKKVEKISVCGGAGGFLLPDAKRAGADVFITADYKYHQFFDANGSLVIADIGHYESEQFTMHLLHDLIVQKFTTFAVRLTGVSTNPVHYY